MGLLWPGYLGRSMKGNHRSESREHGGIHDAEAIRKMWLNRYILHAYFIEWKHIVHTFIACVFNHTFQNVQ